MPHKALYGYAWDYSYVQTSTCYSQRFHIPTEMKPVFITKQNECGVCCSCVHPVKVPVHRIQFCFTTCIIKYVKLICLAVTAAVAVVLQLLAVTRTHSLAFQVMPEIFLEMSPLWLQFFPVLPWLPLAFCVLLLSKIKHAA